MTFLDVKNELEDFPVFSRRDIEMIDPSFHRQRLTEWQKKGYITKIRRGFYRFSDGELNEKILFAIAGEIYSPSYISLQMVFSFYSLIPESVYEITSVTSRKTRTFDTPIAVFKYRHIKPQLMFGYTPQDIGNRTYLMADVEKALLDFLYLNPDINDTSAFEQLRFNVSEWNERVDKRKLERYLEAFENKALKKRVESFLTYIDHA
ncbi:MAG: hypothetical protein WD579_01010 [Candidatus Paceibacterota bacterium]